MPYAALGRLMTESVKATGCESFGLRLGANTKASSLGLTSLVSINSATVRDALQVIVDTLKTSETGGTTFLDIRGGTRVVRLCRRRARRRKRRSDRRRLDRDRAHHHAPPLRPGMAPEPGAADPRSARATEPVLEILRGADRLCRADRLPRLRRRDARPRRCATAIRTMRKSSPRFSKRPPPTRAVDFLSAVKSIIRSQIGSGALSPRQRLPRAGPQRANLRPSARGARRHLFGPRGRSEMRGGAEPAHEGQADRRDRRDPRASPSRAPSPAPSRPGRGRRRRVGAPSAAGAEHSGRRELITIYTRYILPKELHFRGDPKGGRNPPGILGARP